MYVSIRRWKMLVVASLAVLSAGSVTAALAGSSASASASAKWYAAGSELSGSETYAGLAEPSMMTVAGVRTACGHAYYDAKIFNSNGLGKGEVTYLPLYECSASGNGCTLTKDEPKKLPWPLHTVLVGTKPYVVIEGVSLEVGYSGTGCPLSGTHEVAGSLGGAIENASQTVVFSKASEEATGASLKTGASVVEVGGTYTTEAVGAEHHGQHVEAR